MKRGFQQVQREMATYLRDPGAHPAPAGIESRRLTVYSDLFYNNIEGFLRQGFPVLHGILDPAGTWHPLVRRFFSTHACQTPYFTDISAEFVGWLTTGVPPGYPAYAAELAHYEWMELVLALQDAPSPPAGLRASGDVMALCPVLNPVSRTLRYHWPVATLGPDNPDVDPLPEPMHLLMYRDGADTVRFMSINLPTAELLDQLGRASEHPRSGLSHLQHLAESMPDVEPGRVLAFGRSLLEDFLERGILVGLLPCTQASTQSAT